MTKSSFKTPRQNKCEFLIANVVSGHIVFHEFEMHEELLLKLKKNIVKLLTC